MGEHHRDGGDLKAAARCLEDAGDFLEAGDLYRQLEEYPKAAACYRTQSDYAQAAEMFKIAGDRVQAAEMYEKAERFREAAECWALEGNGEKEAQLLEKAGDFLAAGEVYHREGNRGGGDHRAAARRARGEEGFARASALLGDIFGKRGQLSLAIKKLQAGDRRRPMIAREPRGLLHPRHRARLPTRRPPRRSRSSRRSSPSTITTATSSSGCHRRPSEQLSRSSAETPGGSRRPSSASRWRHAERPSRAAIRWWASSAAAAWGSSTRPRTRSLDRIVAYKARHLKENPQALKNFLREAKAAAKLNHPGIVTVYDTGEQDGRFYIAMEYVDGTTLKEILRRDAA